MREAAPKTPVPLSVRRRKLELYATAAIGGLSVFFMQTPPSWAQAINANGVGRYNSAENVTSAFVTQDTGNAMTQIEVRTSKAIVDWDLIGNTTGDYAFSLPNSTAVFYSTSGSGFTVLNVINGGSRAMKFDGTIESHLTNQTGPIGGNVWFYSPGGILVGSGASFNVGSLMLTTLNPDPGNTPGNTFSSFNDGTSGNTVGLRTDTSIFSGDNNSQIQIAAGASISAQNYIGLIAPRIVQGGTMNAGGAIGLIAGEQVDLNISDDGGLFGMSVPLGTSYSGDATSPASAGIVHTGTTTGPATGAAKRNIYMVAVPKNTAVSMLLGGTIGYDIASATPSAEGIVLLAGPGVRASITSELDGVSYTAPTSNAQTGGLAIRDGATFTSRLRAAGTITTAMARDADITFNRGATLLGTDSLGLTVALGRTISSNGALSLIGQLQDGPVLVGGRVTVRVGGTLRVGSGALTIDASSNSNYLSEGATTSGIGGNATGGVVSLTFDDATFEGLTTGSTGGAITMAANARAGDATDGGGNATGGSVSLTLNGNSIVNTSGLTMAANATGGAGQTGSAGSAVGGGATVSLQAGDTNGTPQLRVASNVILSANGIGGTPTCGDECFDGSGQLIRAFGIAAGNGIGGNVLLEMGATDGAIDAGSIALSANGTGGNGGLAIGNGDGAPYDNAAPGASGTGGGARISMSGGIIRALNITVDADGMGGNGGNAQYDAYNQYSETGTGGNGGIGQGGIASVTMAGASRIFDQSGSTFSLTGNGIGGNGGTSETRAAGMGGIGRGDPSNAVRVSLSDTASVARNTIRVTGAASGGTGGVSSQLADANGGAAFANQAVFQSAAGSAVTVTAGTITLDSSATGGVPGNSSGGGTGLGGEATGNNATLSLAGGSLTANTTNLIATAQGGRTGNYGFGVAIAGDAAIGADNAANLQLGNATLDTSASGNLSVLDVAFDVAAGDISILAQAGSVVSAAGGLNLVSYALAGPGSNRGANGQGGSISITADNSTIQAPANVRLDTQGSGGQYTDGTGGFGRGGPQSIRALNGSTITLGSTDVRAMGTGGLGAVGGEGTAANVAVIAQGSTIIVSDLTINASGSGGGFSSGGSISASGGEVILRANSGRFQIAGSLSIDTSTQIGFGNGGAITVETIGNSLFPASSVGGSTSLYASGTDIGGVIAIRNTVTGTESPLNFGDITATSSGRGTSTPHIILDAPTNRINAGQITLDTDVGLSISAADGGGIFASGRLQSAGASTTISGNGVATTVQASEIAVQYGTFTSNNAVINAAGTGENTGFINISGFGDLRTDQLIARSGIRLSSGQSIVVSNARVTDPAVFDGSGQVSTVVGVVGLFAGGYDGRFGSIVSGGNVTVNGTVEAASRASLNARGSIVVNGQVRSQNLIDISAGNDVVISTGGQIVANTAPLSASSGGLSFDVGNGNGTVGDPSTFRNAGLVNANGTPLTIYADAVQSLGGTLAGSSVTIGLKGNTVSGDDSGALSANCVVGTLCLGNITAAGAILVDTQSQTPTSVTLGGTIAGGRLTATAQNGVVLGTAGQTVNMTVTGSVGIYAGTGAITAPGGGTISGSLVDLYGSDLLAAGYTFRTTSGDLGLNITGSVSASSLISAARLGRTPNSFIPGTDHTGSFAAGTLSVGAGDISIAAASIDVGRLLISNGAAIDLNARSGALGIQDAGASTLGTAAMAQLRGTSITIGRIATTGTATLLSSGAITATDLLAAGAIVVNGASVDLTSSGAMTVSQFNSGVGAGRLRAAGQLTIDTAQANDRLSLTSDTAGIAANTLTVGGTTTVQAAGAIVLRDLRSTGTVTANGGSVTVNAATITFGALNTTAGDALITTTGDLVVNGGNAVGSAAFRSSGGQIRAANYGATQDLTLSGATVSAFTSLSGRNVSLTAASGALSGQALGATGTTTLSASGAINIAALRSAGGVSASGSRVTLASPDALTVASVTTTQGDASLRAANLLTVGSGTSAGDLILTSTGGGLTVGTVGAAGSVTGNAAGAIAFDQIGGASVALATTVGGIAGQRLTTAGTATLSAPGAINVAGDLRAASASVTGGSVAMTSTTDLTFATMSSTSGDVAVTTSGALTIGNGSAAGRATLSAGGTIALGTFTSGADLTLSAARLSRFSSLSARNISLTAASGDLNGDTLIASGTTTLSASGAINIAALRSAGGVSASGSRVTLASPDALTVASVTTTQGDASLRAANLLTVGSGTSAGDLILTSTGGGLTVGTVGAAGSVTGNAAGAIAFDQIGGASVALATTVGGIAGQRLTAAGTATLSAPGAISVAGDLRAASASVTGGSVAMTSTTDLTFATMSSTSGDVAVTTSGALTIGNGSAAGRATLSAGGTIALGTFISGTDLTLSAARLSRFSSLAARNISLTATSGDLNGDTLIASGTTTLSASGAINIAALRSAGGVSASGSRVTLASPDALTVASVTTTQGDASLRAANLLTVGSGTSAGDLILTSTGGGLTVGTVGAAGSVTGNAAGAIAFDQIGGASVALATTVGGIAGQRLTTAGTATLSAPGAINVAGDLRAASASVTGGSVAMTSTTDLTFATTSSTSGDVAVTTSGALTIGNGSAAGRATLSAGGTIALGTFISGTDLTLSAARLSRFSSLAARNISLTATSGDLNGDTLIASGTTTLSASGAINIAALRSAGGVSASGSRVTLASPDALTVASVTTTQGDASLRAANLLTVGSGTSAGDLILTSTGGGLTVGTVGAAGSVTGNAAGAIAFDQIGGASVALATTVSGIAGQRLTTAGTATLSAPGAINVAGDLRAASASVTGGSVAMTSTTDLTFATMSSTSGDVAVTTSGALTIGNGSAAGRATLSAGGTIALGTFTSGTDLTLSAARLSRFSSLAARNISLTATSGDLNGDTLIASGTTTLLASGTLSIADVRSGSAVTLAGSTIDIGSTTVLNVANATAGDGGLRLRAGGALTVANATSRAGVDLASTGGNVTIGTIAMTGTPAITTQAVAGTSPLTIASAGTTTLNNAVTGAGAASISGAGLVLNGLIDASAIQLTSQTIGIGPQALIGTLARTGTVSFTNNGTSRSFIGGTGNQSGYSLDGAALGRVQASSIALILPRTSTSSVANPDVVIGALTLYGTGAAAPAGSLQNLGSGVFTITTPGQVQVNGAMRLANLSSTSTGGFAIRAAGIDVVTPNGSIVQTDAQGAPAGTLDLDARTVRVASAGALANVGALDTASAREARLALNDGNLNETGWLSANTIRFAYPAGIARGAGIATIYVQNSGGAAPETRRGVTTGAGGVIITGFPSNDQPEVFLNGRSQSSATTFATGSAFLTSISQTGSSAADILVNGCVLSSGSCGEAPPSPGLSLLSFLAPTQDLVSVITNSTRDDRDEDTNKPGDPMPSTEPLAVVQFIPGNPDAADQSSDDPVLGSGNDSLWTSGGSGQDGGAASSDTTIGIGSEAGQFGNGQSRPGGGIGSNSGGPQQSNGRAQGRNPVTEGGLGVGNDAGAGDGQRSGNTRATGVIGAPNTPANSTTAPDSGGVGFGAETSGGATGPGGNPGIRGAAQGSGNTPGGTTSQRPTTGPANGGGTGQTAPVIAPGSRPAGDPGAAGPYGPANGGSRTIDSASQGTSGDTGTTAFGTTNTNRQANPNNPR